VNGETGVILFFSISGFLITTLLLRENVTTGEISLKRFYIRRILRIFPVAYLFLFVLMALNRVFALHIDAIDFLTCFLYAKNIHILQPASAWQTGHFWSLSVEEQFYLLFPFILKYNYRLYVRLVVALLLFMPVLCVLGSYGIFKGPGEAIASVMIDFGRDMTSILSGSLCALLLFKGMIPLSALAKYRIWAPFLILLIALGRLQSLFPGWNTIWLYLTPVLGSTVLLLSMQPGTLFYRLLNTVLLKRIGVLSYSAYIWQQIFTLKQPWAHVFPHADALWFNLPALALVTCASYYLYEKPFLRLKERFGAGAPKSIVNNDQYPPYATAPIRVDVHQQSPF
jgi:peptidoglycan/LPS O-acetylase OafA/YrhL